MRVTSLLIAGLLLSGCAAQPQAPLKPLLPAPSCSAADECAAMWSQAQIEVQRISGMKLMTVSDTYLQTFPNSRGYMPSGTVRKVPKPDGSTVIQADFACRNACEGLERSATNLFNSSLTSSGKIFLMLQKNNPAPAAAAALSKEDYQKQQIQKLTDKNLPYSEYQKQYKAIMAE